MFPTVPVQKKSDAYFIFPKDDWFRDEIEVRAPGTRARMADYTLSSASYLCIEWSLDKGVADEVRENADSPLKPEVEATEFLKDKLLMGVERRVATLVSNSSLWASASNPGTSWSNDASDPINDIENARDALIQSIGREPNVVIISQETWRYLRKHPDIRDLFKNAQKLITPEMLANAFDFPKVLIGRSIYNSATEGRAVSMSYIWGDMVWLGYVPERPGLMEPAAGYVFRWGADEVKRFRQDLEEQDVFRVSHNVDEVITASDAAAILSNCIS